jgi:hypothetical protein
MCAFARIKSDSLVERRIGRLYLFSTRALQQRDDSCSLSPTRDGQRNEAPASGGGAPSIEAVVAGATCRGGLVRQRLNILGAFNVKALTAESGFREPVDASSAIVLL